MMKRATTVFCAAVALIMTLMCCPVFAAPATNLNIEDGTMDVGALTDRFELLDKLENSLTDEESVVIATRVGVLVSINRALNNNQVSFEGEAVGDLVNAGSGYKWANIMGTSNAVISVYMEDEQASLIQEIGDYHTNGSALRIVGTYHIACPEHQGELDVHAASVEVIDAGGPITHLISPVRLEAAFGFCLAAGLMFVAYLVARNYLKRRADEKRADDDSI